MARVTQPSFGSQIFLDIAASSCREGYRRNATAPFRGVMARMSSGQVEASARGSTAALLAIPAEARIDGALGQDFFRHRKGVRGEMLFGQQCNHLVPFAAPGARRYRQTHDGEDRQARKNSRRAGIGAAKSCFAARVRK